MDKEIKININEDDINSDCTFDKINESTGEFTLNIPIDDLKRKRIEKLDKAHRGIIDKIK